MPVSPSSHQQALVVAASDESRNMLSGGECSHGPGNPAKRGPDPEGRDLKKTGNKSYLSSQLLK